MKRLVLLSVLLMSLCLAGSASAQDQDNCWVCVADNGQAICQHDNTPNFAMSSCEQRCRFILQFVFCMCRTYGTTCGIEPPGFSEPVLQAFVPDLAVMEQISELFDIEVSELFVSEVSAAHEGEVNGTMTISAMGQESPQTARSFRFVGEIETFGAMVKQTYVFKDHPAIVSASGEFWNHGREAVITVDFKSGRQQREYVSSD